MISATSAVFLFYSVMLGVRVLISCDYTFNHNPCDELYGFHGLFTSCDPNFSFKLLFNLLRNRGIHPLWVDDLRRITIGMYMMKCKYLIDCSLVATPIPSNSFLVTSPIPQENKNSMVEYSLSQC